VFVYLDEVVDDDGILALDVPILHGDKPLLTVADLRGGVRTTVRVMVALV
jgi:hypothetical protein